MALISNDAKKELLALTPHDLTFTKMVALLGRVRAPGKECKPTKPRFEPTDTFEITPLDYPLVKKAHVTTIGKFIYNKYVIEGSGVSPATGYVDWEISNSGNKKLENILSKALLNDIINLEQFCKYIDRRDTLGQQLRAVIASSFTPGILKAPDAVIRRREQLVAENREALKNGDVVVSSKIEKELLGMTKEVLKGDPGMDLYTSGARGSFNNNFKNNHLFKGAIFNSITNSYDIVTSSYMEGFSKENIPALGNVVIAGSYPSAVGTQTAGYLTKQLLSALQTEVIGPPGSDCGTKKTVSIKLTQRNSDEFLYRYMVEGSNLVELTTDNVASYIGKEVKFRSPMMCIGKCLCNMCMGNIFNKLGITNVGLTSATVSAQVLQAKLSAKHDGTVKPITLDPNDLLV